MTAVDALYEAARSEYGIVLICQNFTRVRAQLYAARKYLADESLDTLKFKQGPGDELWIVKS